MVLDDTCRVAQHFNVNGDDRDVERLLKEYANLAPRAAMRKLANEMGIEEDHVEHFINGLLEVVAASTAGGEFPEPDKGLTKEEERYLDLLDKELDTQTQKAQEAGKGWRRGRLIAAGSLAAYLGFALSALVGKLATYLGMPMPFQMINISGLLTLVGAEVIGGKLRSRAGGYGAHDSLAYRGYNTCLQKLKGLAIEEAGVQGDRAALRSIEKRRNAEYVKLQKICVDLLRREFGHLLGMKKTTDHVDVPDMSDSYNPFLKRVHTKLQVHVSPDDVVVGDASDGGKSTESTVSATSSSESTESAVGASSLSSSGRSAEQKTSDSASSSSVKVEIDEESEGESRRPGLRIVEDDESERSHELRMPDGTLVFTIEAGATTESFKVTWPGEDQSHDLCKEAVAKKHVDQLMSLAEHLANAAWWRAMVCDENPFIGFSSILMIPGTLTPIIQATMRQSVAGATIDTLQAVGASHFGLVVSYLEQDRLRDKYGGANAGKVANTAVNAAAYERVDWLLSTVRARAEVLADMKTRLTNGSHYLKRQERDLQKSGQPDKAALKKVKAKIEVYEKALRDVDEARKSCVKQRKALLKERQAVESVGKVVARTWRDAMRDFVCVNPAQFAARVISYSLPFIIFSNLYVRYVTQPLRPVEINETTGEAHDGPFGMDWIPVIIASGFYGFVIQGPYQFRNLGIGDRVEGVLQQGGAYTKRGYNALMNALATGRHQDVETARYDDEEVDDAADDPTTDDAKVSPQPARRPEKAKSSKQGTTVDVARLPLGDSDEE